MSELRSRKKTDKNASKPPGENKAPDTRGSLQSFSAALEGLRQEVSGDQNLLATYEHLLQTELTKKVPSLSCHLWYLCKLFLKVLWILILLLIVAGVVVYNVDRLSDAMAIYMQENMYDYMRMFRFAVLALCPYFPRLLKPCLILNPFSPASKCACLDGVVIRNASIADTMSDEASVIFHPQLLNPARSGTVDVYALRKLYYKTLDDMSDPCAEFASEEDENPDDLYYHDLFMSLTDLKEYMQSNRPLKSTWQECADLPRSITKLLPKFPLPHGYKMASGPLVFFGKQWARFYHIPELWEDKQNLILILTLHGEMKLTIDSSYECVEHCPAAHGVQVMKAGDALLLHEKHWAASIQTWSKDHTIMMAVALVRDKA